MSTRRITKSLPITKAFRKLVQNASGSATVSSSAASSSSVGMNTKKHGLGDFFKGFTKSLSAMQKKAEHVTNVKKKNPKKKNNIKRGADLKPKKGDKTKKEKNNLIPRLMDDSFGCQFGFLVYKSKNKCQFG